MKREDLILSLIFPVLGMICSLLVFSGMWFFPGSVFFLSGFICGAVAVVLVAGFKVDTSKYLLHQMVTFVISVGVVFFLMNSILNLEISAVYIVLAILPFLALVLINIYYAVKTKSFKQWLVLFLMHPLMHFILFVVGYMLRN